MWWDTVYKRAVDVCSVCIEKYLMWSEVTCVCMFLITVICMGVWVCVQHLCVCFAAAASCRHCFSVFIFPRCFSLSYLFMAGTAWGSLPILLKPDRETRVEGRARKEDLKMTRWETFVQFFSYLFHYARFLGCLLMFFACSPPTEWKRCNNEVWGLRM